MKTKITSKNKNVICIKINTEKRRRIKDEDELNSQVLQNEKVVLIVVIVSPRLLLLILFRNIINRNKSIIRQENPNQYNNQCNI